MVRVLRSGFYTTIQDLGRGYCQEYGIPISGAMDQRAAKLANSLVGNHEGEAVMEITMSGPKLQFDVPTKIAITGADIKAYVNDKLVVKNRLIQVISGDILSFGKLVSGFRCYLGIYNGFQTQSVLESRSMYANITEVYQLKKGDILMVNNASVETNQHFSNLRVNDQYLNTIKLPVDKGPEFVELNDSQKEKLFSKEFTISKDNNRMAYQLVETVSNNLKPIITSLVLPGTVQLTPSGKLIILMRDCQTTGGYPRVLQLTEIAINTLAQKFTGNKLKFNLLELKA